jgi:hypothetical protein
MAFADPQTMNSVSCPRTSTGINQGEFTSNDGLTKVTVSHQYGAKRTRRTLRYTDAKIAADPLISAQNIRYSMSAYIVVDTPTGGGYTVAQAKAIVDALVAYLAASSGAKVTQLLGGEN